MTYHAKNVIKESFEKKKIRRLVIELQKKYFVADVTIKKTKHSLFFQQYDLLFLEYVLLYCGFFS